jgi:hypothetical protein
VSGGRKKKISTAAAGHRVEEIFLGWRSSVRHGEDEAERCAVSTFSEEEKNTKGLFGLMTNLPHFTTLFCLRLILQFERLTLDKVWHNLRQKS